jgi:hypothetical protein
MVTHTQSHTGRTIALLSGGALLAWLLWRGIGWGSGGIGRGSGGTGKISGKGSSNDRNSTPKLAAVEVWVLRDDRITLNGVSSDLPTVIAHARAVGVARVHVDGWAREGWFKKVREALRAAGVDILEFL